jgi:hypothetical protein
MSVRKDKTEKRTAWLMELGRELRAEYEDFVRTNPLPPRLGALADQVEHAVQTSGDRGQRHLGQRNRLARKAYLPGQVVSVAQPSESCHSGGGWSGRLLGWCP